MCGGDFGSVFLVHATGGVRTLKQRAEARVSNDVVDSAIPLTEMVVAVDLNGVIHQLCTVGEAVRFITTATQYVHSLEYREARKSLEQAAADASFVLYAVKSLRIFLNKERLLVP